MKDHNETFHNMLEQANDSFSLISEYFGRCLFDDPSTVEYKSNKLKSVPLTTVLVPKPVPVIQTLPSPSPILHIQQNTNPFDEDDDNMEYDDNKNPFKEDYDESKNPFAEDI